MDDLQGALENTSPSFPNLSVRGESWEISGQDYTELHRFLEDVRENYEGEFIIRFVESDDDSKFQVKLTTIKLAEFCNKINYERLLRAILGYRNDTFESYWIENGRLFLRGDFENENREISFYGLKLHTVRSAGNGDQIREYIPLRITLEALREFRFRQILEELKCPECGSEGSSIEFKIFRCYNCRSSIDLTGVNCPLTSSVDDMIMHIEDNYSENSDTATF